MRIERKLASLGLGLPEPFKLPPGRAVSGAWVRVRADRAYIAGHCPLAPDGSVAEPLGKIGRDLTPDQGYQAARLATLAILASLKRTLGDLDRVRAWLRIHGLVNTVPEFTLLAGVMNGCSDLILELYGQEAGQHARSAVGAVSLVWDAPIVLEGEVEISPS
jgi:enamine deaminase RidA (YjgF/YER057c/UK114 family)